jgi:hypothetical protein
MVFETMDYLLFNQLIQMLAQGRYSEFSHHESFRLYTVTLALFSNMFKPFHGTDLHVQNIFWYITFN